jgi:hypothetical protein
LRKIRTRRENPDPMADPRCFAIAALGLACASAPERLCDRPSTSDTGRYARVEVALAPDASSLSPDAAARLVAWVRQSARDWLEQRDRLAPDGELALVVTIGSARLRSPTVTWFFAWATAPDHLAAQVLVVRGSEPASRCPVRVESALAGYSWRDPEARLERLARRLGHRIAEEL